MKNTRQCEEQLLPRSNQNKFTFQNEKKTQEEQSTQYMWPNARNPPNWRKVFLSVGVFKVKKCK